MNPERWSRIKALFDSLVELEPEARAPYLESHCDDPRLAQDVLELLAADERDTQFLERTSLGLADLAYEEALAVKLATDEDEGDSLTGHQIDQFEIGERLGAGGMGEVYAGFDARLQRRVALKAIRSRQRMDAEARGRFLREARILSNLDHPGICRIYDYVESEECDLLVLELIEGRSLRRMLGDELDAGLRFDIAEQISEALAAAHAEGVVHRDLKPSNVMLTTDREVKVLDFGLARAVGEGPRETEVDPQPSPDGAGSATATSGFGSATRFHTAQGLVTGTPSAMSPEQLHGGEATPASDMYSYGLLLQELFTGEAPYDPELKLPELVLRARRGDTRRARGADADLIELIERLKSGNARERPTAAQARERLEWIRSKPRRRLRLAALTALLVALSLAGLKYTVDLQRERAVAVAAQERADLRRGQAEDLIGFMLGDLRSKLEPIGRLEILDDVGDEALQYFAAVPEAELTDNELHSRSQALAQIGEVRTAQGNLGEAQRAFDESLVLARGLADRRPNNLRYLAGLGAAHFWVGSVHWWRNDADAALTEFRSYLAVAERLVASEPDHSDWQMELSYAHSNIGLVLASSGRRREALSEFRRALELNQSVVDTAPADSTWLSDLADARSWVAETLAELGELREGLSEGRAYQAQLLELADERPDDAELANMVADSFDNVGSLLLHLGQLREARDQFDRSAAAYRDLVRIDPQNSAWKKGLLLARVRAGEVLLELGRPGEAATQLEGACAGFDTLLELDDTNRNWSFESGVCQALHGAALVSSGSGEGAREVIGELLERMASGALGELNDEAGGALRGHALLVLGDALDSLGRPEEARAAWRAALQAIEGVSMEAPRTTTLDLHAQVLSRLGRSPEARPIETALEQTGYRRTYLASPGSGRGSTTTKERP